MSEDERYNGWTNRETWAVALHINNDQGWQESVLEALENLRADHAPMAWEAGEIVRENVEQVLDPAAVVTDLVADYAVHYVKHLLPILHDIGSLWRVDWTEIGAAFLSDLEEQDAYSSGRGSDEPTHNLDED